MKKALLFRVIVLLVALPAAEGIVRLGVKWIPEPEGSPLQPDASVLRIAAFGDSYTHGDDVSNKDTWESQLERMHSRLEVLNFGVGGYVSSVAAPTAQRHQ